MLTKLLVRLPQSAARIVFTACAFLLPALVLASAVNAFDGPAAGGAVITNRAEVRYRDEVGGEYATASPLVSVTVSVVSGINVTPDETSPSSSTAPDERVERLFRICNTGNTPDAFTLLSADVSAPATLVGLHLDADASGTLDQGDTPVAVGTGVTPRLTAGQCAGVIAVVATNASAPQSTLVVHLSARSNLGGAAGGTREDTGAIVIAVGGGPKLSDPDDPSARPIKLVNDHQHEVVTPEQVLTYSISFRNSGAVPARSVVVRDELPPEIAHVAGSLRLNGRALTEVADSDQGRVAGALLEVLLSEVAPGELVQIKFQARLTANIQPGRGIVNRATLWGENVEMGNTSSTVAVVDPFGTIYAARSGGGLLINGAQVTLSNDDTGSAPLTLPPGNGFPPNLPNDNPYTTVSNGRFSFALLPDQFGTADTPVRYVLKVNAPDYRPRRLEVVLRPNQAGIYSAAVRALDGLPVARNGGFELTDGQVLIENLAALALNVPMFESSTLELTKAADRQQASVGDVVTYRVEAHNATLMNLSDVTLRDLLPPSFHYAEGTARLEAGAGSSSAALTPEVTGGELLFRLGELKAGARAAITYRVRIGANARDGRQTNTANASGRFPSGERVTSAPANAAVLVGRGIFSTQQIIIGRVYEDLNSNARFDRGDKPVAGARLYLHNGQSVTTDSAGQYNVPSVEDGSAVISLDPTTLPAGVTLADSGARSGRSWTRLLRTPLGGGGLLHQDFALRGGGNSARTDDEVVHTPSRSNVKASAAASANNGDADETADASLSKVSLTTTKRTGSEGEAATNGDSARAATRVAVVLPGDVRVLSPRPDEVIAGAALQIEASVAAGWSVALVVNGARVADTNIAVRRLDRVSKTQTLSFAGLNLRPGRNHLKAVAQGPRGEMGSVVELDFYGRGPARRLEIVPEKAEVQAGGRDSTLLRVRAFDEWGHPAADGPVNVEASAGRLMPITQETTGGQEAQSRSNLSSAVDVTGRRGSEEFAESGDAQARQRIVSLAGGEAVLRLFADGEVGTARIRAASGNVETSAEVRVVAELRPSLLVGLAEVTVGRSAPEMELRGEDASARTRLSFFYRGSIGDKNLLTLAYDSNRPLNRTAGRDRMFQLDPLERVYPIFGDSSTRFNEAPSNSKLFARLDRGRSYAMFGDFDAELNSAGLASYSRRLTGAKLHLENSRGDQVTLTGARPDTAFARDVFAGSQPGFVRLSRREVLPGSEVVVLEVRDRRNPETIISRESLVRSVDYNLDADTGYIYFLRPLSAFDPALNLVQVVVTYEHHAEGMSSAVYTARAVKNVEGLGLKLGLSLVEQKQAESGSFVLGGIDAEKKLPHGGHIKVEWATSRGRSTFNGNLFSTGGNEGDGRHDGNALRVELEQPLAVREAVVRAGFSRSDADFLNPFGMTVAPGSTRAHASLDFKPRASSTVRVGFMDERNRTENVDNERSTLSLGWTERFGERLRASFSYDYRKFTDRQGEREVSSNLLTAGVEWRATDKLQLSVKREQNLGEADPTYPDQTTLAASYQVNPLARIFFTQRLASAPIVPISDVGLTGFAATSSRRETALGVETRLGRHTSLSGRYQLENGLNGTDSFAVIGLQHRLPLSKELAVDFGFEHGQHLAGAGRNFTGGNVGLSWQPLEGFRSTARYELRNQQGGSGSLFAIGAAGRPTDGVTALVRLQRSHATFAGRETAALDGTAALAFRPLEGDRAGLLFTYTRRSFMQYGDGDLSGTRERSDTLSSDGYYRATGTLELYGRFALKYGDDARADLARVSTFTYLAQLRAQQRLAESFDVAAEMRLLAQPVTATRRTSYGMELGFWPLADLRLGLGYNFTGEKEPWRVSVPTGAGGGFYFTLSSKLSNLFDLFGTSRTGLATETDEKERTDGSSTR